MSSWGWGNSIFEINIFTWVFKYEVEKLSFFFFIFLWIHYFFWKSQKRFTDAKWKKVGVTFFLFYIEFILFSWKFQKPVSICVLVGGFNFWLGTYNVPEVPSANSYGEARRAEFDGMGRMGRVGQVGRWSFLSFYFHHT